MAGNLQSSYSQVYNPVLSHPVQSNPSCTFHIYSTMRANHVRCFLMDFNTISRHLFIIFSFLSFIYRFIHQLLTTCSHKGETQTSNMHHQKEASQAGIPTTWVSQFSWSVFSTHCCYDFKFHVKNPIFHTSLPKRYDIFAYFLRNMDVLLI